MVMRAAVLTSPLALTLLTACWTGPVGPEPAASAAESAAPAARPGALEIRLERTACFGRCPIFQVTLHGDGRIAWTGAKNVAAHGERVARISPTRVAEIDRALDRVRFFELDATGHLPRKPACTTTRTANGSTMTCSFQSYTVCSDTSHAILRVRRAGKMHEVDSAGCSDDREVWQIVEQIEQLPEVSAWIDAP